MPSRARRRQATAVRMLIIAVVASLLAALATVVTPTPASAAGTVLFSNLFNNRTVDGTGTVSVPAPASGSNTACLTASGNSSVLPLLSCSGNVDTQGNGKLRLTGTGANQVGGVFGQNSFPSSSGLDVTFNSYQWGGNSGDGLAFMLAAVDPENPSAPASIGPSGGSLGYARAASVRGLSNAYLGVGLDVFGNFSNPSVTGTGCTNPANINATTPGAMVVRGPGNGTAGYCGLTTTYDGTAASKLVLRATTRAASAVPIQVLVNPTATAFTSTSGVTVAAGTYKVVVKPVGQTSKTLTGTLPTVAAGLYPATSWLNASGVPKQLAFGFVGSTGSVTDMHEISDVKALTFAAVPQLAISSTSYSAATSGPGDPVTYRLDASVQAGAAETSPISVTETVPTGVVAVGAYGSGWTCEPPVGREITCTTTGSSFAAGTALPAITVVAIVTGTNVTSTQIQASSVARVSSADASPGTDTTSTAGTLPTAPSGLMLIPSNGSVDGGGSLIISGSNITAATAIEIGTTAEQQAGTPLTLLPCPGGVPRAGCFIVSGGFLYVSPMPGRANVAAVSVNVVTNGVDASAAYVYGDQPAAPATPTATAGITSATVSWVAPDSNLSAITSYIVTPYLGGVAQTPQSFAATATTRTLTGLTAGGVYTFTVEAVNGRGTSDASAKSAAVVPYALPGTPTITAVSARSQGASLTWNAPSANGSAITAYVVTPYIGTVAQPSQSFGGSLTNATVTGLTAGTAYTFTVAAQNSAGTGPASAKSSAVTPNQSPSLTFPAPPAGEAGVAYSRQLTVTNGTSPFVWSVSSGALPDGMTLNASTGLLSGTPTESGSFAFTVRVVDVSNQSATKAVTLTIAAAPTLAFDPPAGAVGVAYSQQPVVSGGTGPFVWTTSAGSLPAGVTLNSASGLVSGTPTSSGSSTASITATDSFGQTATKTVTIVVVALPTFDAGAPPLGQVGVEYDTTLAVTGGTKPMTWAITAGSLPAGLTLDTSSGEVTGTPTSTGSSALTARVTDANGKTASKSFTLVIGAGPLVIDKSANVSTAAAGSVVAYTISITNTGSTAWSGASLSDPLSGVLDDAAYSGNATATSGTLSYASSTIGWSGNVAAGATVQITYSVTVKNPDTGNKVLSNTVTSTTLGTNCAAASSDARCSATVNVPGLTIVKTADTVTTTPGSVVKFSIVVTNTGPTPYTGATLSDGIAGVLDDAAYNTDGAATSGNISYTRPTLSWTGNLAVGASATITYSVTVADPDAGNRILTGTVVSPSAGSPCPADSPAAQCTTTVNVLVPAMSITNTANLSSTAPGQVVSYTVTLANTGQTAYTGTAVKIDLAKALDDATYRDDAAATAGTVVYSAPGSALTWTGDLAVGATVTVTASVSVRNPASGDKTLTTVASSAARGSTCATGSANPACTSTVQVLVPQLTIAASTDVSTATPGSVVRYTTSVTNTGQSSYSGAALTQAMTGILDDATYNDDVATTAGAAAVSATALSWSGNLLPGASATITYSVTVRVPDSGNRSLTTTASSATPGNNCPAGGNEPKCSTSVSVLIPGLSIDTSADSTTTTPGAVVRFSVTVTNSGETAYNGVGVNLDLAGILDDARYNNDATSTSGSLVVGAGGSVSWVLSLAPGASASSTMTVTVGEPPGGDKVLRGVVASDAQGSSCPVGAAAPACRTAVTVLIPGLTITKTADSSTVNPGGAVGYTISVVNNGETAYPAARITDDLTRVLTDAVYSGGVSASTGAVTYSDSVLTWTGALAPGASATITYSVTVRDPAPGDKQLINTAVSSSAGSNCAAASTDPRCTAAVSVLVPGLTIVKTAGATTTRPGATIDYTIAVTNSGATSFAAATFADSMAGVLDDAGYNSDAAADRGTLSFSGSTLSWTGGLPVGETATITYSVTVHAADGGNNLVTNVVTSTTTGNNCPLAAADPRCTSTVPVARLVLAQSYQEPSTTPGAVLHLSATFTNTGKVPYTGITVSSPSGDTVDDAIPTGDQTATSGTLVLGATAISWSGSIPVGGVVTVTGTLTVKDPDPGNKVITGTLVSTAPGNTCPAGGTDPRCTATTTVLLPGLTMSKTADAVSVEPGDAVAYTITVVNSGQTPYSDAKVTDSLTGVLDDAEYDGDVTASRGTTVYSDSTLTWTGDLAVGQSAVITYSVTTTSPATGDKNMTNPVNSSEVGSTCPAASGNPACVSSVLVLTPALTIVKTADLTNATLGTTVGYTITVANSGQTAYAAASVQDDLAGVLDDADYNADAAASTGTIGYAGGTLTWTGGLDPGDAAIITYTTTINNPASGDRAMTNTAASTTEGNNCAAGSTDGRCTAAVTITNSVSLTFTKTAGVATTVATDVVDYTVTVANSSTSPVAAANFTDPLTGLVDDATYNDDAVASAGAVQHTGSNLGWTGTVPALGTITMTYSVTVNGTATGDQVLDGTVSSTSLPASNNCIAGSDDPRCASVVPVASLTIQQSASESTTTPGSVVHLTQTFTNTGKVPYTGISIVSPRGDTGDDTVPTGDQTATSGTFVRTATDITWTGDIPVGGTVTATRTLTVRNPDTGNKRITATVFSTAPGNNCPVGGSDARCTFLTTVLLPSLTMTKTADTATTQPGRTVGYTITVANTGETAYTGASVTDSLTGVLDDAAYNADVTATSGATAYSDATLTWSGDLAVGQSAVITYSLTTHSPATGDKTMINPVSSHDVGSTCPPASDNTACRSTVVVLTPALTIASTASAPTTVPGATISYRITVANTGQTAYAPATVSVPLEDVLDDATYGSDAAATTGTVSVAGESLTWSGGLNPGAAAVTITYTVTVDQPGDGDSRLEQTVVSTNQGNNCPASGSDPRCTTSVSVAGLQITNSADVATTKPTSVVRNTVSFTNSGAVPYVGISLSDSFVGSLDDATYNGDATATAGSLILVTGTGRIAWTGDLAVGETVVVTGSLTVNNPDLGDRTMTTRVSTDAIASNCPTTDPAAVCTSSVTVLTPGLAISTAADAVTATPGATVGYTLTVTNTGQTAYAAAVVTDRLDGVLDDGVYSGDASATSGDVAYASPVLTWTGDLGVGESVTITYSVVVSDPDPGDKSMINDVRSDELGSSCPSGGPATPACSGLVTVLVPALDIAVTADRTTTVPGATVGYTVLVRNTGQTDYTGATFTAALAGVVDDAAYPGDATATTGVLTSSTPDLQWTGDLEVGATATITYSVTVADPVLGNRQLSTSVTSSTPGNSCVDAAPCINTVTVLIPGLSVSTTADVATATPGDRVVFTINVTNTGQTPYAGTVVRGGLVDVLDDATFGGTVTASSGVAAYTAPNISWTGSLEVDATVTITYAVTVKDPANGDKTMTTRVLAPASGSTCQESSVDPACTASVTVLIPALTITKSSDRATTTPGGVVTYDIVITNSGQTAYDAAAVEDSLRGVLTDSEYNDDAAVVGGGLLDYTDATLSWTGALALGASATISYSVTVDDPDVGDKLMTNTVTSTSPGSSCPPAAAPATCTALVRVLIPGLTVTKTADTGTVVAGGSVTYTISLTNSGQTDYTPAHFTDSLEDVLDDATYAGDATATTGTLEYADNTLAWTGGLAVGETAVISYSVAATFPAAGDRTMTNTVASDSAGADCAGGTGPACTTTVDVVVPALKVTKSADTNAVVAGGAVHYTISATNTGASDYPAAVLTDSLADVLDDAVYNADAIATTGDLAYAAGTISWSGALARGATVTITYSVSLPDPGTGDGTLFNEVSSTSVGSTCTGDGTDSDCATSISVAARSITLTGLTPSFALSGLPNSTTSADSVVAMTVTTNSPGGYQVSVQAGGASMAGATAGNNATIPINRLSVRESGTSIFRELSAASSLVVHDQDTVSSPDGDAVSNDFRIEIPFVPSDTYTATLDYVASTQ